MKNRPLILDTDGGVDDAQALLMLIGAGYTPDAITTVFGNVGLEAATHNILTTLAVAGVDTPVHMGADRPLSQPIIDATYVHGDDGLGNAPRPDDIPGPTSQDAVQFLRDTFRNAKETSERVDILMIGPLTNLALALRMEPSIIDGIGKLTIMGGTVYGRGNTTPAAEFNIYADPEAAGIVFGADIETVVVPWEPCVTHKMDGPAVDALFETVPESELKTFSKALVEHARKISVGFGAGDNFKFVDPLAAAVLVEPTIITKSVTASVDVALAPGITRGMTLVDPSRRLGTPPVVLVEEANVDAVTAIYAKSLIAS